MLWSICSSSQAVVVELSEMDDRRGVSGGAQGGNSPRSSATGLSRLLPGKTATEKELDGGKGKSSNFLDLWKATENEGSVLKRLIKIVASQPKTDRRSLETSTAPVDKIAAPTPTEPLPAVPAEPLETPPIKQSPELDATPVLPATQSKCDPAYLEQPDSKFLAHTDGPSPMVVVPDSPYIHRRMSRAEKAAKASKPEPEWHGIAVNDSSAQSSQDSGLSNIPSPDELRQLTTGKHKQVVEHEEPPVPVQSKVSRMTPERSSSERVEIFFAELKVKLKELFAPRL